MKKIFCLILISLIALTACGRKGALTYPEVRQKPKLDKISDEMTKPMSDEMPKSVK